MPEPFRLRPGKTPYYVSLDPFVHWRQAERPVDWNERFGRLAPLWVEIGFGNGEALIRRANEHSDRNHVGIEVAWESIKRALRRAAKSGSDNVRMVQVDAYIALQRLFRTGSIERVIALFPVPWPKERHEKYRIFSRSFFRLLNNRLADGGEMQLVTDFLPLAEWTLEQLADTGLEAEMATTSPRFSTKYERKWQDNGQGLFYELKINKKRHLDAPVPEDLPLQNYHLDTFNPQTFTPVDQTGPVTVIFKDFLYDPDRKKGMVRALVAEEKLLQDIWIKIVFDREHWLVGLSQIVHVVPTEGVKMALDLAYRSAKASS